MFRIGNYFIDPQALELMPESIARENDVVPLRLANDRFHLLIGSNRHDLDDLLQKLEFILNRELVLEFDDPILVHEMVHTLYSMAAASVSRCNLRFSLTCSRRWLELIETGPPSVRHCPDCNEAVYHCENEEQALEHAALGHCVSLHDSRYEVEVVESMGLIDFSSMTVFPVFDNRETPEQQKEVDHMDRR